METKFKSIAQESPYVLPRIEAPIQQFKDAVKHCEKWLEGAEPVMEQLHHLQQLPDHERGNVKNQVLLLASALGKWPLVSKLLHNDADPNCEHESSKLTPLHLTTLGGHVSTTQTLLSVPSINVNATDAAGNTPLMCAAQSGFHALVAPLLNHSADYSARNNKGYTAFDVALANGRIKVLKMLMEKWNPLDATNLEEKRNFYKACCFEASKNSWTDILALLENHGVSLNIQSESAADLVLTSCVYMQEGILHFLVARDVPLDQPEHEGMRPLFHACYNGSFNMVKLLCEKHADINAQDSQGRSPAFMAAAGGHLQILQHLEEQECDLNVITKSGDSLLEAAIDSGNFELFVYLRERVQRPANSRATLAHRAAEKLRTDILEAELSEDRDLIEKEDFDGNTPLLLACQRGSKQLLTLLQKLGADFSHANQKGNTPALLLSAIGNLQLLQIVHKAGGDLDHPNWKGDTPILMACRYNHFSVVKFFSDHGCTMDCANYLGQTPAFFSARHAKKELLRFLVEQKAPVDDETTDGMTPLLVAAKADHTESVKILLRSNCRVEQVNSEGRNIVSFSAINGNVEMLNMAIENKADLLVRETSGNTAVIDACRYGRLEVLEILSKQACPLDAKNYESRSGLHLAAEFGFIKIANFLLEKEVNCNSRDKLGNTPLMLAAEKGFYKIIQLLNQKECDVHLYNKEGKTALHFASLGNNTRSIQLLLIAGCNPMQTDNAGATPLMLSCQSSKPEDKNSNEAFKMLCEFSATDGRRSLFFYDNRMQTCVHYAAEVGQYRILEELHNLGLRMDEPNRDGETPLIIAAKGRYRKSVEFLITKCSASVSAVDNKGQSAVHKAALKGHLPVVQLLETNGAEMDRPDSCGRTPLLLAASRGFDSIVNFLQDKRCIDTIVCRERNENILHLAAIGGHTTIIERLKDRQDLVESFTTEGESCLTLLLKSRDCPDLAVLLLTKFHAKYPDSCGQKELLIAARFGHKATLKVILSHPCCNKDAVDSEGNSALMLSAREGHHTCVRQLLDSGLDLKRRNNNGATALHLCCANGKRLCADFLLDASENEGVEESFVDWKDKHGDTALINAVRSGLSGLVRTLIRKGARWDIANNQGYSAWTYAFSSHRLDFLSFLKEKGHPPETLELLLNVSNLIGNSKFVLDVFQKALLQKKQAFLDKFLLFFADRMTDLTQPCSDGSYLLHACSEMNLTSAASKLLKEGADIECLDRQNQTPFLRAVAKNRTDMAKFLRKKGCKIYVVDVEGRDALMLASINRNHALFDWLLCLNLKVGLQDKYGYSALHHVAKQGSRPMFKTLLLECSEKVAGLVENKHGLTMAHLAARRGNGRLLLEIGNSIHRNLLKTTPGKPSTFGIACYRGWTNIVKKLIALGHSPPVTEMSPYIAAACAGGHLQVLIELLKDGSVNPSRSVFQAAGRHGKLSVVDYLLTTFPENNNRNDILIAAVAQGHSHIVRYMLDQKISADQMDDRQNMPCHVAALRSHASLLPSLVCGELHSAPLNGRRRTLLHLACIGGQESVVRLLLSNATDEFIAAEDGDKCSALLHACSQGSKEIVALLLKQNSVNPNSCGGLHGTTGVHLACQAGRQDLLEVLATAGAALDAADLEGSTGLLMAAARGHADVVRYLLANGCKWDAVNKHGANVIQLAVSGNHMSILTILCEHNFLQPQCFANQCPDAQLEVGHPIGSSASPGDEDCALAYNNLDLCKEMKLGAENADVVEEPDAGPEAGESTSVVNSEGLAVHAGINDDEDEINDVGSWIESRGGRASGAAFSTRQLSVTSSNFARCGTIHELEDGADSSELKLRGTFGRATNFWTVEAQQNSKGDWLVKKCLSWSETPDSDPSKTLGNLKLLLRKLYALKRRENRFSDKSHLLWPIEFSIAYHSRIEVCIVHPYVKWHLLQYLDQLYSNRDQDSRLEDVSFHKSITSGVLHGLAELHRRSLVHGSLTLKSVYLTQDKRVMLKGFDGINDILAEFLEPTRNRLLRDAHTKAPELFRDRNRQPTKESDIWSLGILLHQLVTGKTPLANKYDTEVKDFYLEGQVARLPEFLSLGDAQLQSVLAGSCRIDPNSRKSACELMEILRPTARHTSCCEAVDDD
ncbi:hypothetical protein BOX15_Mlig018177g1 [Macrostomum lignano]|uniref:Protein kinase domain-containing protein n=1 Tax=Macrostomum lignano TaxID=282301 RepID=A0A267E774_9PLAT|nr:hypothetical protein BOX15_Mlig018177g1 [Macrostomum lignano]